MLPIYQNQPRLWVSFTLEFKTTPLRPKGQIIQNISNIQHQHAYNTHFLKKTQFPMGIHDPNIKIMINIVQDS